MHTFYSSISCSYKLWEIIKISPVICIFFSNVTATQDGNKELMNELKGKAEFFQQYIMERFRKIREQRTVATNTEHECETIQRAPGIERLVHDCDEALSAKVRLENITYPFTAWYSSSNIKPA